MIAFRDFAPLRTRASSLLKRAEYESMGDALERANQWIGENRVDVVNVETVLLPNPQSAGQGSYSALFRVLGGAYGGSARWRQIVRVWYSK